MENQTNASLCRTLTKINMCKRFIKKTFLHRNEYLLLSKI